MLGMNALIFLRVILAVHASKRLWFAIALTFPHSAAMIPASLDAIQRQNVH